MYLNEVCIKTWIHDSGMARARHRRRHDDRAARGSESGMTVRQHRTTTPEACCLPRGVRHGFGILRSRRALAPAAAILDMQAGRFSSRRDRGRLWVVQRRPTHAGTSPGRHDPIIRAGVSRRLVKEENGHRELRRGSTQRTPSGSASWADRPIGDGDASQSDEHACLTGGRGGAGARHSRLCLPRSRCRAGQARRRSIYGRSRSSS